MEETIMKCGSTAKRLVLATVAAAALVGSVTAAHAVQIAQGDAVLAVYGNGTEYVRNLGSYSNLISTGLNLDLSSILGQVSAGGLPVKYTIVGATDTAIFFGDKFQLTDWTTRQINQLVPNTLVGGVATWGGALAAPGSGQDANPSFFAQSNPLSFSSNLNPSGSDTFGGTTPAARPGFANIGETLYLMTKASPLTQVGTAILNANGQVQIGQVSAVPVPAAVVLFASGLVGLVGLARRRMSGTSQKAA
jgi:hypothetical protein